MNDVFYEMEVAGLKRKLPINKLTDEMCIAAFIIFGDVELTCACARDLIKRIPEHDIMVTAEAKSIPLIHEMARQMGVNKYIVARKGIKAYMREPFGVDVNSITTRTQQTLYVGLDEQQLMKDKRVLIVDDVISTGESLRAIEALVRRSGGNIVGRVAILAEGDSVYRDDIIYLEKRPLFDAQGNPIPFEKIAD